MGLKKRHRRRVGLPDPLLATLHPQDGRYLNHPAVDEES